MAQPVFNLTLGSTPHEGAYGYPGQAHWLAACKRFRTVCIAVGRQVGKTTLVPFLFLEEGGESKVIYTAAYMAQGHPQAETMYERILQDFETGKIVLRSKNKGQDRLIETIPFNDNKGMRLYFWSGEATAHEAAHGKSLHRGVPDEASLLPEQAVFGTMVPMFNATKGKLLVLGSPFPDGIGFTWFEKLWLRGNPADPNRSPTHFSFNAPSESNPYADLETIAEGRAACMSRELELCLYDGKFARDLGAVFPNLSDVFCLSQYRHETTVMGDLWVAEEPSVQHGYVAGLDFGSLNDSTVLMIFTNEPQPRQVALLRVRGAYTQQMTEITRLLDKYRKPLLYVEGREGGMVLTEVLRQRYEQACIVIRWSEGGRYDKTSSIVRAVDFFQQRAIRMMDVPWQRDEFRLFSKRQRVRGEPSRGVKYEAPSGGHDDSVAALCYACYGLPLVPRILTSVPDNTPAPFSTEFWDMCRVTQRTNYFGQGASQMAW